MKIFSTFSGIGGFEVGIQNAYRSTLGREQEDSERESQAGQRLQSSQRQDTSAKKRRPSKRSTNQSDKGPLFIGYSEVDKYAIKVYERHYDHKNYGDITKIKEEELPDFDCLVGGFPCQAFSIAGKRGGFEDTRGTLFYDLARILQAKKPRLFVFENVKGLLSHDGGRTFKTIISTIDQLGYDCQWQVLNSKNFGVPQNRERVYIIGHLRGTPRPQVFPISQNSRADIVLPTLTARYYGAQANGGYIGNKSSEIKQVNQPKHSNDRVYSDDGISPTLNTMQGGNRQPKIIDDTQGFDGIRTFDISPTMRANRSGLKVSNGGGRIRRLTPLECERLQAFPDGWTAVGGDGLPMSDTQRYKMCGNAVTTNVVQAIFERILCTE